jgi:membrane-bound ClpP family serine protease
MRNGIEALLGEQGVVSASIPGSIHLGTVRARGEDWPAVSAVGNPIAEGEVVLILEVDRGHLVVAPAGDPLG